MRRRELLVGGSLAVLTAPVGSANSAPNYPAPSGSPGAPFADPNLKLAIMSGLLDKGAIDLGTSTELAEHVLRRKVDFETEGYDPIPAVRDYLERYPLTPEILRQADSLILDGGNSIYFYIWFFWHGEDDTFDVENLAGLGNCPNIKSLDLISMIGLVDLRHLVPMPQLQDLRVGVGIANIPALLDMPALRSVQILNDRIYDEVMTPGHPTRSVMEMLKERGVSIWVHWVSSSVGDLPAYE